MRLSLVFSACLMLTSAVAAPVESLVEQSEQHDDIKLGVVLDATEQSGLASATVRIRAGREIVWTLVTSCADALVLVPGLVECTVLETAHDGSWQKIRHVLNYSWYVPKLTYELRATYDKPSSVSIERIAGDLKTLKVAWSLRTDGEYTIAQYTVELSPGFWVPHWIVRVALRRDLPKMLRALRSRAELLQQR